MSVPIMHKQLLDGLSTAVILLSDNLSLEYLNSSAEALLQVSLQRVSGSLVSDVFNDTSDFLPELKNALINDDRSYAKREAKIMLHNSKSILVDYIVTTIDSETAGDKYLLIEIHSRDQLVRICREEELISVQNTTRSLLAGLAHEIKNPLGGIRGAAQLLERELPDQNLKEYTNIVIEESDRLRNLVDRMLGPHRAVRWEEMNLHEVLERVRSIVAVEADGGIILSRDYDPSIPNFLADAEQLIQAILNIVRNAMQAIRRQSVEGQGHIMLKTRIMRQFTIGQVRHRLVCKVNITDNGPGIPEKIKKTLFYPMVSGYSEGTGLGLSIAQSIINRHQGIIEYDSKPGKTTFSLLIPLELC